MSEPKPTWTKIDRADRSPKIILIFRAPDAFQHKTVFDSLTYLNTVSEWSRNTGCGKRLSWDQWSFQTEADRTMFLIRWS